MDETRPSYTYGVLHMPRWEVSIPVARLGRTHFLPVRLTCKAIGVDPQTQFAVIHSRYADTAREIHFNIKGVGWRAYLCLPEDDAALWIAGINPKRCKLTARGTLAEFVAEAKRVLTALLFKPDYVPPTPGEAGVLRHTSTVETVFACPCGRHWRIVTENGVSHFELIGGDIAAEDTEEDEED